MLQESSSDLSLLSNNECEKNPLYSIVLKFFDSSSNKSPPKDVFLSQAENKNTIKKKFAENNKVFRKVIPENNWGIFILRVQEFLLE
jgi:hypothetical protein